MSEATKCSWTTEDQKLIKTSSWWEKIHKYNSLSKLSKRAWRQFAMIKTCLFCKLFWNTLESISVKCSWNLTCYHTSEPFLLPLLFIFEVGSVCYYLVKIDMQILVMRNSLILKIPEFWCFLFAFWRLYVCLGVTGNTIKHIALQFGFSFVVWLVFLNQSRSNRKPYVKWHNFSSIKMSVAICCPPLHESSAKGENCSKLHIDALKEVLITRLHPWLKQWPSSYCNWIIV